MAKLTKGEKRNRLLLGKFARRAKKRSVEGISDDGAMFLLHSKIADKYERQGDKARGRSHRVYADDHLKAWLRAKR